MVGQLQFTHFGPGFQAREPDRTRRHTGASPDRWPHSGFSRPSPGGHVSLEGGIATLTAQSPPNVETLRTRRDPTGRSYLDIRSPGAGISHELSHTGRRKNSTGVSIFEPPDPGSKSTAQGLTCSSLVRPGAQGLLRADLRGSGRPFKRAPAPQEAATASRTHQKTSRRNKHSFRFPQKRGIITRNRNTSCLLSMSGRPDMTCSTSSAGQNWRLIQEVTPPPPGSFRESMHAVIQANINHQASQMMSGAISVDQRRHQRRMALVSGNSPEGHHFRAPFIRLHSERHHRSHGILGSCTATGTGSAPLPDPPVRGGINIAGCYKSSRRPDQAGGRDDRYHPRCACAPSAVLASNTSIAGR